MSEPFTIEKEKLHTPNVKPLHPIHKNEDFSIQNRSQTEVIKIYLL